MRAKLRRDLNLLVLKLRPSKASSFFPMAELQRREGRERRIWFMLSSFEWKCYKRKEEKTRYDIRRLLSNEVSEVGINDLKG